MSSLTVTGLIVASLALVVIAFSGLALSLRPGRFGRGAPRLRLRIAALGTVVWAIVAGVAAISGRVTAEVAQLLDLVLIALWLWQLESFMGWLSQPQWFRRLMLYAAPVSVAAVTITLATPALSVSAGTVAQVLPVLGVVLSALGLVALEQIYRSASASAQPALRWFGLGVGGLLLTRLIIFAEVLIFGGMPVGPWIVQGLLLAAAALAIARGARLMPDWQVGFAVSRTVAFYTTSILAIGAYLVLLSVAGLLLGALPARSGLVAQSMFWAVGIGGLLFMLFSESWRRRVRVFVTSHFFSQRYDYRAEWLRFIATLSDESEGASLRQRAIRSVAQIIESPRGVLWRRSDDGARFEAAAVWPDRLVAVSLADIDVNDPLVRFFSSTAWLVDLRELREQPRVYRELVLDSTRYAEDEDALLVPLMQGERLYGWLALERPALLGELNFEDRDLLKTAGRQVAVHLSQFDSDAQLAQSRQFEAYSRMTAFVMHDLKNIAAQLRLISQNAERHRRNPEFVEDAMRTIGGSAARMAKLVAQLTAGAQDGQIREGTMQTLDLGGVAERAAMRCGDRAPVPLVIVHARPTVFAEDERLVSVVEHAIRNAQDATAETGEIRVEVDVDGRQPVLTVRDTGSGMDETFVRERLFRPFDTTKGTRGMGIGAFQMREYLRSLGGSIDVESTPGQGTRFRFLFPMVDARAHARLAG